MLSFVRPDGLAKALALLGEDQWTIVAGGTDYYPALKSAAPRRPVLDISLLHELRGISQQDEQIRVGALTTWSDIAQAQLPPAFKALQQAALEVGSRQIQNRASIAGNICNASPAADGVPPLLILNASVEIISPGGTRVVPLQDFIRGNRRTCLCDNELVSAILVPREAVAGHSDFLKLGARRYLVISIGMVAARMTVADGIIHEASVAIGACSEVAARLPRIEQLLTGKSLLEDPVDAIDVSLIPQLSPIDDIRATAEYRSAAAVQLIRRAVTSCVEASQWQPA